MVYLYKYKPEDFNNILGMSEDLSLFYSLLDKYIKTKSKIDRYALVNHWENLLFFTIKHREVEGTISPPLASNMRDYLEGLLYD